jgi:hypothetical protein
LVGAFAACATSGVGAGAAAVVAPFEPLLASAVVDVAFEAVAAAVPVPVLAAVVVLVVVVVFASSFVVVHWVPSYEFGLAD